MARIPLTRLEPMDGQRPMIQSNVDGIYNSLSEENAAMRDVHPLGVVVARGDGMDEFKRRLSEKSLDRVLLFEGIPEEYKLKVYSGFHRLTAASRYVEAHRDDPHPPSAATRSWLCAVYDADVADDPDLPVLMVAHNIEAIHSKASIKEWIHSLQFSGDDPARIKTAIGLTAHGDNVSNLCVVRCSMLWEPLVTYGTLDFNKSLNLPTIASWGGYCAEFEILKILLEDAVRQQRHISTFKKGLEPLTPFDIFGPVWGESGHKQSGDMENVRKDWEKAKICGFGTAKSTWSFNSFWKKAIVDEKGQAFLFGDVIFVPEDLRGDPKGGKRKDMAGYVILRHARAALSCFSTLLFAGDFEYRCARTPATIPDPWVVTIMEKQGVDKRHVDEFIRLLVARLGALVTESQVREQPPHQVAHNIFKKTGHNDETLRQMVWTEITDHDCHAAWEDFLLTCEEEFGFGKHDDLWNIVTEIADAKVAAQADTRKSTRQKATQTVNAVKEKVVSTKKVVSRANQRQILPSSSDSDEEVQITSRTQRKGRTYKSKDSPIPEKTRNSGRRAALSTTKQALEEDDEEEKEGEEADKNKDGDVPMVEFQDDKDTTSQTPSDEDTMMLDSQQVGDDDTETNTLDLELLAVTARIENEVARWRDAQSGPKALELLRSLANQLALGP